MARKQNCPEGFNYIRCDGSIFEDIPGEFVHDNNNDNLAADNIDVHPYENNDKVHEDVEINEVHKEVENDEEYDDIDVLDEDLDALDDNVHNDIDDATINDEAKVEALA